MNINDEETPAWVRWTLGAVALTLVGATALGGWLLLKGDPEPAAPPSSVADHTATTSPCRLTGVSQRVPSKAPKVTWKTLPNGSRGPVHATAGPGQADDGVHSCFAKSPTGAALATGWLWLDAAQPSDARRSLRLLSRATAATEKRMRAEAPEGESSEGAEPMTVAGFRFVDVQPTRVTVEMLCETHESLVRFGVTLTAAWEDNDWRIDMPGQPAARVLDDSSGFLLFEGAFS